MKEDRQYKLALFAVILWVLFITCLTLGTK